MRLLRHLQQLLRRVAPAVLVLRDERGALDPCKPELAGWPLGNTPDAGGGTIEKQGHVPDLRHLHTHYSGDGMILRAAREREEELIGCSRALGLFKEVRGRYTPHGAYVSTIILDVGKLAKWEAND